MPRPNIYYGWYIALAGCLSNFIILGIALFSFSVFIEPMAAELGWSVAAISGAASIRTFEQGFGSPLAGFLADRIGARKLAILGVLLLGIGLVLYSQVHSIWVFYLSALILAMGQSFGPPTSFGMTVMKWFTRLRGRAIGIVYAGNGMGAFAVPILAALVMAVGWRDTLLILAAFIVLTGLPLAMTLRSNPQAYGYLPDGAQPDAKDAGEGREKAAGKPEWGLSVGEALRKPAFYLLAIASAGAISTQITWLVHQVPHLRNVGYSMGTIGFLAVSYGVVQIVARLLAGWMGDYIGQRNIFIASFVLQGAGLLAAASLSPDRPWLLPLFLLTMPIGHSALVVSWNTTVADYFGTKRYASIRGLQATFSLPLGVSTPVIAGWMFDQTGSYRMILAIYAALAASGVLFALLAGRPPGAAQRGLASNPA